MSTKIQNFKDLIVWKKSVLLAEKVFHLTNTFPKSETFGLISQMRRSAVSIPSNIAEGSRRSTKKDFTQFLRMAHGSGAELETQLYLSKKISLGEIVRYNECDLLLEEVSKMLSSLISKLQTTN